MVGMSDPKEQKWLERYGYGKLRWKAPKGKGHSFSEKHEFIFGNVSGENTSIFVTDLQRIFSLGQDSQLSIQRFSPGDKVRCYNDCNEIVRGVVMETRSDGRYLVTDLRLDGKTIVNRSLRRINCAYGLGTLALEPPQLAEPQPPSVSSERFVSVDVINHVSRREYCPEIEKRKEEQIRAFRERRARRIQRAADRVAESKSWCTMM